MRPLLDQARLGPFALALLLVASHGHAAERASDYDGQMFNITIGKTQIFDGGGQPTRFGLEFRGRPSASWRLIPAIGAATSNSGARFVYSDVRRDFPIGAHWLAIPSFGVGWFRVGGDLQLGSAVEFRSGLELAYLLPREYRVGLALFHLSNGGLATHNPGTEVLVMSLCIPLKRAGMPVWRHF